MKKYFEEEKKNIINLPAGIPIYRDAGRHLRGDLLKFRIKNLGCGILNQ